MREGEDGVPDAVTHVDVEHPEDKYIVSTCISMACDYDLWVSKRSFSEWILITQQDFQC